MTISRRGVLLQGGVIGAALIAENLPIMSAFADPIPKRMAINGRAWNDPVVEAYRDGVAAMRDRLDTDKFSWVNFSRIHGSLSGGFHYCPHGNWYFLPWHRAYLTSYERVIRKLTSNNSFAMPYWDWSADGHIPEAFLGKTLPNGSTNSLCVLEAGKDRTWPSGDALDAEWIGPNVYSEVLGKTPYEVFGTSRPEGQNGHEQSWITNRGGAQGLLESNPHNNVHINIGGWMPTAQSPMDPLFFMHHGNIDRIWAVWNHNGNANSDDPLWTGMQFQNNFYNADGSFWSPLVSELFVPDDLGYTYGLGVARVAARFTALENKFAQLFDHPNVAAAGIKQFTATNTADLLGTPQHSFALSLAVDQALLTEVAKSTARPAPLHSAPLDHQPAAGTATRIVAFLRNVKASRPDDAHYRVFLNAGRPTPDTSQDDPHYVGSFAIFSHGMAMDMAPTFQLDLTATVSRLYGNFAHAPKDLSLQLVPVANKTSKDAGTVSARSVEVVFLTP